MLMRWRFSPEKNLWAFKRVAIVKFESYCILLTRVDSALGTSEGNKPLKDALLYILSYFPLGMACSYISEFFVESRLAPW